MRKTTIAVGLALLATCVWAEPAARAKTAAKPAPRTHAARPTPETKAEPDVPMGQDELAIAQRVHQGRLPCELGASVHVEPDHVQPGYFNVQGKGFHYRMHPVVTSTGAIRLEDKHAGAVWLQLANKSMLMDQKKGQRVADECAHPEQVAFAEQMKRNPPPPLIDVNTGR